MTVEPLSRPARRFEYLDLIRLLCAAAVVAFHYATIAPYTGVVSKDFYFAPNVFVYGQFGVHVFFIISGFVITLSARGRGPFEFGWARFLRLYPAYWICCALAALVLYSFGQVHQTLWNPNFTGFLVNLTMLQSFVGVADVDHAYWSLAVEMRFYAIVGLLMVLRLRIDSLWVMGGWLLLCVAAPHGPALLGKLGMVTFAPYFIVGVLIQSMIDPAGRILKIVMCLIAAFLAADEMITQHAVHVARDYFPYDPYVAIGIVFGGGLLVLACTFMPQPRHYGTLMTKLGAMTYPLYLLHSAIGLVLLHELAGLAPSPLVFALVTLVVLAAVIVIALVLEPWLRQRLRNLEKFAMARWLRRRDRRAFDAQSA